MAKRRAEEAEAENSERWLLTYSDMITLLLALFVVLFAMSSISVRKFDEFKTGLLQTFSQMQLQSALKGGTGLLEHRSLVAHPGITPGPVTPSVPQAGQGASQIANAISEALAAKGLASDVQIAVERRGVVVRLLSDKVFFANDSATLGPVGTEVVNVIGNVVAPLPNDIVVEGYTDSLPIVGGPFSSNFELSAVRAVTVLEQLMRVDGVPADRLSATGYGDTHPIVPNTTPANMALNRRVDVVILNTSASDRL